MVDRFGRYEPLIKKFKSEIVDNDQRSRLQSNRLPVVQQNKASNLQRDLPGAAKGKVPIKREFVTASLYFKEEASPRPVAIVTSGPNRPVTNVSSRPPQPATIVGRRRDRPVGNVTSLLKRPVVIVADRPNVIQSSHSESEIVGVAVNQRITANPQKQQITTNLQKQQITTSSPLKEAEALLQLSGDVQKSPRDSSDRESNLEASSSAHTSKGEEDESCDEGQYGLWYIVRNGRVLYTCRHCEYTSINVATFKRHVLVKHKISELEIKIKKKKPRPEKQPKPPKPPKKPEIRYDPKKPAVLTTVRTLQKRNQLAIISKPLEEVVIQEDLTPPETAPVEIEVQQFETPNDQTEPQPSANVIVEPASSYEQIVADENADNNIVDFGEVDADQGNEEAAAPTYSSDTDDDDEALYRSGYINYKTVVVKLPSVGKNTDLSLYSKQTSQEDAPLKEAQALLQLSCDGEQPAPNSDFNSTGNGPDSEAKTLDYEWFQIRDNKIVCKCIHCDFETTYRTSFKRHLFIKHKTVIEYEVVKAKKDKPKEKKKYKRKNKPKKKPSNAPPKKPEITYNPAMPIMITTVRKLQKVNI